MKSRPFKPAGKLNDGIMPLRERITFAEAWREYVTGVMPDDASVTQRIETKRSFYAGAFAFFRLTLGNFDADHEPTELDLQYMTNLNDELVSFFAAIGTADEVKAVATDARP